MVYVCGDTDGAFAGYSAAGGQDVFLQAFDSAGNPAWVRQFGFSENDFGYGVAADTSGVYLVGETPGTLPGQTTKGGADSFVRKYDPAGAEVWTRQPGSNNGDEARAVTIASSGGYLAGITGGVFEGETSAGYYDAYVRRFRLVDEPPVPNDDFDAATAIGTAPFTGNQDVAGATTAVDDPFFNCGGGGQKYKTVWFRYTAPQAEVLTIDTFGSTYDTVLAVWTGSRGSLVSVACNDDSGGAQSRVQVAANAGATYYVEVASDIATPTDSQLTLHLQSGPTVANDDFDTATAIGTTPFTGNQDATWSTTAADDPVLPCGGGGQKYKTVWFRYTAPQAEVLTIDTFGSGYDTVLAVWTGSRGSLVSVACNDDSGSLQSEVGFPAATGTIYHIEVASYFPSPASPQLALHLSSATPPGSFGKTAPVDGATGQSLTPTLSWGSSAGAAYFEYCYDTTNDSVCSSWTGVGSGTSVGLVGLAPGTTYYWQVRAGNGAGVTSADAGVWWSFATGTPPAAFSKLAPVDGAAGVSPDPTLSWGLSAGADSYAYCYDMSNDNYCENYWDSQTAATSVNLTGLAPGTYYWHVRAGNDFGVTYSDGDVWWQFTVGGAAGLFTKTSPTDGAEVNTPVPTLDWNAPADGGSVDYYQYCVITTDPTIAPCPETDWKPAAGTTATQVAIPEAEKLVANTLYFWQVRAVNGSGATLADGGAYWSFTTGGPPVDFAKIGPANNAVGVSLTPTLSWDNFGDADHYEYCYVVSPTTTCSAGNWKLVPGGSGAGQVTIPAGSPLSPGKKYYWHVRAINDFGTTYGHWGAYWSFTTRPGKIEPADGAPGVALKPTLKWGAASGAAYYEYCVGTAEGNCRKINWTKVTSSNSIVSVTLTTSLAAGETYYWQVRAHYNSGNVNVNFDGSNNPAWWKLTTRPVKIEPADGAPGVALKPTLKWGAASGADHYHYCVGTGKGKCDYVAWTEVRSTAAVVSATLTKSLVAGTTYYWQVEAQYPGDVVVRYDGTGPTKWWKLTTGNAPDAFAKTSPEAGAADQALKPTLAWGSAARAISYQYCVDTSNDNACAAASAGVSTGWVSVGTSTSAKVTASLSMGTVYYWQVKAINNFGTTFGNGSAASAWWKLTSVADSDGDGIEDPEELWAIRTFMPEFVYDNEEHIYYKKPGEYGLVSGRDFRNSDVSFLYQVTWGTCKKFASDDAYAPATEPRNLMVLTIVALYRYDYIPIETPPYGKRFAHFGDAEAVRICLSRTELKPGGPATVQHTRIASGETRWYRPVYVIVKRHGHADWYPNPKRSLTWDDDASWGNTYDTPTHVVLYVSEGKHAMYPSTDECGDSGTGPYTEDCHPDTRVRRLLNVWENVGEGAEPLRFAPGGAFGGGLPASDRVESVWNGQQRYCGGYDVFSPDASHGIAPFYSQEWCAGVIASNWVGALAARTIVVQTDSDGNADTDTNAYLHIFGVPGRAEYIYIGGPDNKGPCPVGQDCDVDPHYDSLEKGAKDTFNGIRFVDVGAIDRVCLHVDEDSNDWAVRWVKVGGKTIYFTTKGKPTWLDADDDDPLWACRDYDTSAVVGWPSGVWKPTIPD